MRLSVLHTMSPADDFKFLCACPDVSVVKKNKLMFSLKWGSLLELDKVALVFSISPAYVVD